MNPHADTLTDWRVDPRVEERTRAIVENMTLEEKVELVTGDLNYDYGFYSAPVDRAGIPAITMADGPPGLRLNDKVNAGRATALPAPIALAASWDTDLAREYGAVIGRESRASGHNVFLGPAVDVARVPVGGRTFESFGEDPLLNGRMASAEIEAIQSTGVLACLKHFVANNQEYERGTVDVVVSERALREIYLRPFESVVRSTAVASVMGAFNQVNGTFCCQHRALLHQVLRQEWGFRGWVMSDYGATHATAESALAGLDQEQPSGVFYAGALLQALRRGEVALGTLDEMCRRIVRTLVGLGALDRMESVTLDQDITAGHRDVARRVAECGSVLLKNDDGLLPVDARTLRRVVVVGVDADGVAAAGGGSGKVRPAYAVSLVDGLKAALGEKVAVEYFQGSDPLSAADLLDGAESIPSGFLRTPDGGSGVLAALWANTDWDGAPTAVLTMPQPSLNLGFFHFPGISGASARYPSIPVELTGRLSARFEGSLVPPTSGSYVVTVTYLGTVRVWVDDELVLSESYHAGGVGGATSSGAGGVPATPVSGAATDSTAPDGPPAGAVGGPDPIVRRLPLDLEARPEGHRLVIEYSADAPTQGGITGAQLRLGWETPVRTTPPLALQAAAAATHSDLAIVVVRAYESEQTDRPSMLLPNGQNELVRVVAEANPRTVVVTMTGAPVDISPWDALVPAVLHAWYPGQEQGAAIAGILTGRVEPSGRLPLSFPVNDASGLINEGRAQYPGVEGRVHYREELEVGYRGYDSRKVLPRFPFGFGLGYTTFEYDALQIEVVAGVLQVTCRVTNTGDRPGTETVQLYAGIPSPGQPPKRLVGWQRVTVEPGDSVTTQILVDPECHERPLDVWTASGWERWSGEITVHVGSDAENIRLEQVATIPGPTVH